MKFAWRRVGCCLVLLSAMCRGDEDLPAPRPWDSCFWIEGKGGTCGSEQSPRRFQGFLEPEQLAKESGPWSELSFILRDHPKTSVKWSELGKLGGHRIRHIQYFLVDKTDSDSPERFGGLILIETGSGIFSRMLEWWGGPLPEPKLHMVGNVPVLVAARDFGGNIPEVMTWAWVWTAKGPMRIEVEKAISEATGKVGRGGYQSGLNWPQLTMTTGAWASGYPGKVGVEEEVEAWFTLRGNRLVVKSVECRKLFDTEAAVIRWP